MDDSHIAALEAQVIGRICLQAGFTHIDEKVVHVLKEMLSLSIKKTLVGIKCEGEHGHRSNINIFDVLDSLKSCRSNLLRNVNNRGSGVGYSHSNSHNNVTISVLLSFLKSKPYYYAHYEVYNNFHKSKSLLRSAYDLDCDVWRIANSFEDENHQETFSTKLMDIKPQNLSHSKSLSAESVSLMLGDEGENCASPLSDSNLRLPKIKDQTSTPRPSYMAEHLPSLPPPYTYLHTDTWATREADRVIMAKIKAEQQRQIEQNLFNLLKKTNVIKDIINYDELS